MTRKQHDKVEEAIRHLLVAVGSAKLLLAESASIQNAITILRSMDDMDDMAGGHLPTIREMKGLVPDFTGGLSLQEFLD